MNKKVMPLEQGVNFFMLGTPYVEWNDRPIGIPRRQVRHLLYYLALSVEPVSRELLRSYFWPDLTDGQSSRYLTQLIFHARQIFPLKNVLVNSPDQIYLDWNQVWSDVDVLRSLEHVHEISDRETAEYARAVTGLYRGSLLNGIDSTGSIELENDIESQRWHLERIYLNNLHNLIIWETQQGHYQSALEYTNKYLMIDDLCEEIYQHAISLHILLGNRKKAVEQFQTCEQTLARELNLKSSEKTQRIYQDALAGRVHTHFKKDEPPALIMAGKEKIKFVGRKDSLQMLIGRAEEAVWGKGGVILIHGELGCGKTRLVKEAVLRIREDALIPWSNCYIGLQAVPFQPVIQALLDIKKCKHRFCNFPEKQLEEILSLPLKEMVEKPHREGVNRSIKEFSKAYYYSLVGEFLLAVARSCSPVIFCMEDINHADKETLEFLNFLAPQICQERLLIISTYCCLVSDLLKQSINHLQMQESYRGTIKLGGFNEQEISLLAGNYLKGCLVTPSLTKKLMKLTNGNPLFVKALLEWSHYSPIPFETRFDSPDYLLPPTIQKTIKLLLERLEPSLRDLLNLAAVLGNTFTYEQLAGSSNLSSTQLLDHLDELVNRHFLMEENERYCFRHELLHSVILKSMGCARAREMKRCAKTEKDLPKNS